MKIKVRFFGYVAEKAGRTDFDVEADPTVAALVEAVKRKLPALSTLPPSVRFAVNTDYASLSTALKPGDTVSFIPPVGGG